MYNVFIINKSSVFYVLLKWKYINITSKVFLKYQK